MIIEAGYDLFELFAPKLFAKRGSKVRRTTWVIAMDGDLRTLHLTKVSGDASTPIENRIPEVVNALNKRAIHTVAYYAVAHLDTALHEGYDDQFEHFEETLRMAPELIEHELLGLYFSNGRGFFSSGPHYSFRDYPGYEHLPRSASIPGPHEYPCSCLACTQYEEVLHRIRQRHNAAANDTP